VPFSSAAKSHLRPPLNGSKHSYISLEWFAVRARPFAQSITNSHLRSLKVISCSLDPLGRKPAGSGPENFRASQ